MVFIRINWTLFTPLLDTVGIYNICKIHILNYLKTNTMKKLLLFLLLISFISYSQGYRKLTRQGEKAYEENDYAIATISSIKALQQKQNFKKSIELFEKSIINAALNQ